jgi:hypothetical protein
MVSTTKETLSQSQNIPDTNLWGINESFKSPARTQERPKSALASSKTTSFPQFEGGVSGGAIRRPQSSGHYLPKPAPIHDPIRSTSNSAVSQQKEREKMSMNSLPDSMSRFESDDDEQGPQGTAFVDTDPRVQTRLEANKQAKLHGMQGATGVGSLLDMQIRHLQEQQTVSENVNTANSGKKVTQLRQVVNHKKNDTPTSVAKSTSKRIKSKQRQMTDVYSSPVVGTKVAIPQHRGVKPSTTKLQSSGLANMRPSRSAPSLRSAAIADTPKKSNFGVLF